MASSSPIVPCLWMDDQAEEAARFYTETLPDGKPKRARSRGSPSIGV